MEETPFRIFRLGSQDVTMMHKLLELFAEVFEMTAIPKPGETYLKALLGKSDFVVLAVLHGQDLVGGVTAYELPQYYSDSAELFIYDIAVRPIFQQKGAGRAILQALKTHCRENKINNLFVTAHEEDSHALEFYRATGGLAEKVVLFNYPLT